MSYCTANASIDCLRWLDDGLECSESGVGGWFKCEVIAAKIVSTQFTYLLHK
jgi:hypothetical protein